MDVTNTSAGQRFFHQWLRWWLWLTCLGVGYHGGQLVMLAGRNQLDTGVFVFASGVVGYMLFDVPIGALVALVATLMPNLKIFPTSLMGGILRVITVGFVLGLASVYSNPSLFGPATAQATTPPRPIANGDRTACLRAYGSGHYKDGVPACRRLVLQYVPRLQNMAHTTDMHAVLNDTWDMLRVTYVLAFGYKQNGEPANARQTALHSVGWGIFSLGAMEQLDPKHQNAQYAAMRSEMSKDLRALDTSFPGVVSEERKAVEESTSH